jgi:hypothetical protein
MPGIVARANENVVLLLLEIAVVLAIHKQQVYAHAFGWGLFQGVRHSHQHGSAGGAIVGSGNRRVGTVVFRVVRARPGVPVGQEEEPIAGAGIEPRDEIGERQRVTFLGDVLPALHDYRIGTLVKQRIHPGSLCLVGGSPGDSVAETDLPLEVSERGSAVELVGRNVGLWRAGEEAEGEELEVANGHG